MDAATDRLVVFLVPHLYLTVFAVSAIDAIGRQRAFFLIVPAAILAIVGYRLWRRRRHGTARADELCGPAEPERNRILR